jgi:hypothetical protein
LTKERVGASLATSAAFLLADAIALTWAKHAYPDHAYTIAALIGAVAAALARWAAPRILKRLP